MEQWQPLSRVQQCSTGMEPQVLLELHESWRRRYITLLHDCYRTCNITSGPLTLCTCHASTLPAPCPQSAPHCMLVSLYAGYVTVLRCGLSATLLDSWAKFVRTSSPACCHVLTPSYALQCRMVQVSPAARSSLPLRRTSAHLMSSRSSSPQQEQHSLAQDGPGWSAMVASLR